MPQLLLPQRLLAAALLGTGTVSMAAPVSLDGGRYSYDPATVPPTMILNASWYREFARNNSDSDVCPVTAETEVVVFAVKKPWPGCGQAPGCTSARTSLEAVALWQSWTALFRWLNFKVATVGPAHMLDPNCGGRLRELGVKVFVMPGGDTQLYAAFTECRDHVNGFIGGGGLFVGSCGGFGYLTSKAFNMHNQTDTSNVFFTTMLDVLPAERGPVFGVGNMTPMVNQTPADVMRLPSGGPYGEPHGAAVLVTLSDGAVGGYAGGSTAAGKRPLDVDIFQRFSQVQGEPVAAMHAHGHGRNVLGFVYHPELEIGLPEVAAESVGVFARQVLQPGDTHDLPLLQLRMWQSFGRRLLTAMETAKLPVGSSVAIPEILRYQNPATGTVWRRVKGEAALVSSSV